LTAKLLIDDSKIVIFVSKIPTFRPMIAILAVMLVIIATKTKILAATMLIFATKIKIIAAKISNFASVMPYNARKTNYRFQKGATIDSRRNAITSNAIVHSEHIPSATTEASAPKLPPQSQSGPVRVDTRNPSGRVPETGMP